MPDRRPWLMPTVLLLVLGLLALALSASGMVTQSDDSDERVDGNRVHVVTSGETLWRIADRYDSSIDAIAEANRLADPGVLRVGQRLIIPDQDYTPILVPTTVPSLRSPLGTPGTTLLPTPSLRRPATQVEPSEVLAVNAHHYTDMARSNIRTINGRRAVVPSPIYANGIYARDAFYALVGLEDLDLSEEAFRWFEGAQDPKTGQITTAVPFDPADTSLQPQDDETTLLFLIWAGLLHRDGRTIDMQVVEDAWRFIQSHVEDDLYVSPPGEFRYWADCWDLSRPDVISYNQGFYALAARFALEMGVSDVTPQTVSDAVGGYRSRFRPELGFVSLSAWREGSALQDASALLPELLHRFYFYDGMLDNDAVLSTVDHLLTTASVSLDDGSLIGIKNMATANGNFVVPANFACTTMRRPGDYHNGGYWPMYTLAELALAYSIEPDDQYRVTIEELVERELVDGSPKEYWELSPGREGVLQPGRDDYSWNALLVPAFRHAGLID